MLTAIVQQSVVKLAKQNGADAYLAKPIGLQDLAGVLNTLVKPGTKIPSIQRS
jgi:AmiR/NasT family two-component response regulator